MQQSKSHFNWDAYRRSATPVTLCDAMAVVSAAFLPWSTSLFAIFIVAFLIALVPVIDWSAFRESIKRPASAIAIVFVALAIIGVLWANDIPWSERWRGINPAMKILAIPFLIYHFERSTRGAWMLMAFAASCAVLLIASSLTFFLPGVFPIVQPGIPVKNYIAQSQQFAFCAFCLAGAASLYVRDRRWTLAFALLALAVAFIANLVFVVSSRTVLVCIPVLFVCFAFRYFNRTGLLVSIVGALAIGALAWQVSPALQMRVTKVADEYRLYTEKHEATSTGQRLEFWRKSIKFVERSPLWGLGTGSIRTLFERDAIGQTKVSAEVIANPHNQTLNVAIQWGLLGVIVLYAMWSIHFRLFWGPGLAAWVGLVAVVENFVSSLFNSHLFDFTEGWLYVIAVGVAAGMVRKADGANTLMAKRQPDSRS